MSSSAQPDIVASPVWYVSYGSNMSSERLACYIEGGRPPGGTRTNPGARDRRLPERSVPVDLPGTVYFAGQSPQWGGGVAFYDHETPGWTAARGYLVTAGQLADIAAQEMYRVPQDGDPLEEIVLGSLEGGRHEVGPGRYETLVEVGRHEDVPLLTFTAPHGVDHVEHTVPSEAYLDTVRLGLRESRGWDDERLATYLDSVVPATSPIEG
ncbi:MAG TPA: hypothetical protein VNC22_17405 [Sporichthya sp.]|nr:hypothetical protein [Sporichthya sp.]